MQQVLQQQIHYIFKLLTPCGRLSWLPVRTFLARQNSVTKTAAILVHRRVRLKVEIREIHLLCEIHLPKGRNLRNPRAI